MKKKQKSLIEQLERPHVLKIILSLLPPPDIKFIALNLEYLLFWLPHHPNKSTNRLISRWSIKTPKDTKIASPTRMPTNHVFPSLVRNWGRNVEPQLTLGFNSFVRSVTENPCSRYRIPCLIFRKTWVILFACRSLVCLRVDVATNSDSTDDSEFPSFPTSCECECYVCTTLTQDNSGRNQNGVDLCICETIYRPHKQRSLKIG